MKKYILICIIISFVTLSNAQEAESEQLTISMNCDSLTSEDVYSDDAADIRSKYSIYENKWLVISATDRDRSKLICKDGAIINTDFFNGLKNDFYICVVGYFDNTDDARRFSQKLGFETYLKNARQFKIPNLNENVTKISKENSLDNLNLCQNSINCIVTENFITIGHDIDKSFYKVWFSNKWLVLEPVSMNTREEDIIAGSNFSNLNNNNCYRVIKAYSYYDDKLAILKSKEFIGSFVRYSGFYNNIQSMKTLTDEKGIFFLYSLGNEISLRCFFERQKEMEIKPLQGEDIDTESIKKMKIDTFNVINQKEVESFTCDIDYIPDFYLFTLCESIKMLFCQLISPENTALTQSIIIIFTLEGNIIFTKTIDDSWEVGVYELNGENCDQRFYIKVEQRYGERKKNILLWNGKKFVNRDEE